MDAKEIERRISRVKDEIQKEVTDRLPRKVGVVAANHFKQNFRDGGFTDGGVKQWKRTKRQDGNTTDAKYSPLTSRRNHLMRSIQSETSPGQVTISNPVPYAAVHNEGGTINTHPTITKRMRRMAWAKVYALSGVKGKGKLPKTYLLELRCGRLSHSRKRQSLISQHAFHDVSSLVIAVS